MGTDRGDKKRILLKIGTSTLTKGTDSISRGKIEDIGRQIIGLSDHYEFILVCSGAIAVAKQFVNLEGSGQEITVKQALAAIGQPHLMRIFQESFRELKLLTAQCLLSYLDFDHHQTRDNIINTIETLLLNNYIPIINENDTVATEEIQFGDNDRLAALTARLLKVDLLIMATNTYGLYDIEALKDNQRVTVKEITEIQHLQAQVGNIKSDQGSGGMKSKLDAAAIAQSAGIETWLVNGNEENFLIKAIKQQVPYSIIRSNTS